MPTNPRRKTHSDCSLDAASGWHLMTFADKKSATDFKRWHGKQPREYRMVGPDTVDFSPHWCPPWIAMGRVMDVSRLRDYAASRDDTFYEQNQPARLAGFSRRLYDEQPASWGLDRIDQRHLPLDQEYKPPSDGKDVLVYILDTGVDPDKYQFGNRLQKGFSVFKNEPDTLDNSDHGTLVAGIVGARDYGVAPGCKLVPVKVWSGDGGSTCTIACGICGVIHRHLATPSFERRTVIINLSVYARRSRTLDDIVQYAVSKGILVVVAAGNDGDDIDEYSPGRLGDKQGILTVGATYESDAMWEQSNEGAQVSMLAPGVDITTMDVDDFTGTSAAAPHVAGVAALYLAENRDRNNPPEDVKCALVNGATQNVIQSTVDSPNLLIFSDKAPAASPGHPPTTHDP